MGLARPKDAVDGLAVVPFKSVFWSNLVIINIIFVLDISKKVDVVRKWKGKLV